MPTRDEMNRSGGNEKGALSVQLPELVQQAIQQTKSKVDALEMLKHHSDRVVEQKASELFPEIDTDSPKVQGEVADLFDSLLLPTTRVEVLTDG